jgi:hypothetical protein
MPGFLLPVEEILVLSRFCLLSHLPFSWHAKPESSVCLSTSHRRSDFPPLKRRRRGIDGLHPAVNRSSMSVYRPSRVDRQSPPQRYYAAFNQPIGRFIWPFQIQISSRSPILDSKMSGRRLNWITAAFRPPEVIEWGENTMAPCAACRSRAVLLLQGHSQECASHKTEQCCD